VLRLEECPEENYKMPEARSEEREVITAFRAATTASLQLLIRCLERSGTLKRGEFAEALQAYVEAEKEEADVSDLVLTMMHDLRLALLD
jgi:hypothetical protein